MARIVIEGCAVATVDPAGTEYAEGHVVVEGDRIVAVGPGSAPPSDGTRIDGTGCLATPGLVNTHHHLYQWATRGRAQQADLFGWLHELYPVWARIDAETVAASATAGLGWLALSGCTTSADHHYVFPRGAGDLLGATIAAAAKAGLRFHPDAAAVRRLGAAGTGVAPGPSANGRLGSGIARVRDLLDAGAPVGLGVDGAASEEAGQLGGELRQALLFARLRGGPAALTAREALELGTMGGARCLGRDAELGSLEPGKLADVALWNLAGLGHAGIADPVAALVFGAPAPLTLLLVNGEPVVRDGMLCRVDADDLARRVVTL